MRNIDYVKKFDPEVGAAMDSELERQQGNIELIASENIVSEAVMAAMGTILTNKYAEGYPGKRYYGGCEKVQETELKSFSALNMQTCSPIAVHRQILQYTSLSSNPVIQSWV